MPPLGAVVSGVTVKAAVALRPLPFVELTVLAPVALAPPVQEYAFENGDAAWVEESAPKTAGKSTCRIPD